MLTFELNVPGVDITHPVETLTWRGRAEAVQFELLVPSTVTSGLIGTVWVTLDGVPLGHVKFRLDVQSQPPATGAEPVGDLAARYRGARADRVAALTPGSREALPSQPSRVRGPSAPLGHVGP